MAERAGIGVQCVNRARWGVLGRSQPRSHPPPGPNTVCTSHSPVCTTNSSKQKPQTIVEYCPVHPDRAHGTALQSRTSASEPGRVSRENGLEQRHHTGLHWEDVPEWVCWAPPDPGGPHQATLSPVCTHTTPTKHCVHKPQPRAQPNSNE